jgi:triacylglycerol lipase
MAAKWSETWPTTVMGALVRPETYFGAAREITSLVQCARRYPWGLRTERSRRSSPRWPGEAETAGPDRRSPVVLIHGYGHNHSGWWVMRKHLRDGGFGEVETFDYSPVAEDIPATARRLAATVDAVRRRTGAPKVHLVGHSLGGLLARWYVQELDGAAAVDTVVTLGTPHQGTFAAFAAPGRTAAQLRPNSWIIQRLEKTAARARSVRWVAFYSNVDYMVQPSRSAMIRSPDLDAVNILAKDHGHVSLILSPRVARTVVAQLQAAEGVEGIAPLSGLPRTAPPAQPASAGDEADGAGSLRVLGAPGAL